MSDIFYNGLHVTDAEVRHTKDGRWEPGETEIVLHQVVLADKEFFETEWGEIVNVEEGETLPWSLLEDVQYQWPGLEKAVWEEYRREHR